MKQNAIGMINIILVIALILLLNSPSIVLNSLAWV